MNYSADKTSLVMELFGLSKPIAYEIEETVKKAICESVEEHGGLLLSDICKKIDEYTPDARCFGYFVLGGLQEKMDRDTLSAAVVKYLL